MNIYIFEIVEVLGGKKRSHHILLLGMDSLMIHNCNHDDTNKDKSWSDDGLETQSNGLWIKENTQKLDSL